MELIKIRESSGRRKSLETLISAVEGKPFSDVKERIQQRIEQILQEAQTRYAKTFPAFSQEEQIVLRWAYYDAIQLYRNAKPRKLGGPYFQHPDKAFRIALYSGVSDITTLIGILYHDVIEEEIASVKQKKYEDALRKQVENSFTMRGKKTDRRKERTEQSLEHTLIMRYLCNIEEQISSGLQENNVLEDHAKQYAHDVKEILTLITRHSYELYYNSIAHIFAPRQKVCEENIERTITAKFCDLSANTAELERSSNAAARNDNVLFSLLVGHYEKYESGDLTAEELLGKFNALAQERAGKHPAKKEGEFTGDKRLYQCFKNILLINRYRQRKVLEEKPVREVATIFLSDATRRETEKILNHLCTYHCGTAQFNHRKVYEIYEQHQKYDACGGYRSTTKPGKHPFDGIIQRFFDARVRGDNHALKELYDNRELMLMAAIAFHHIAKMFMEDPEYYLEGFTKSGIRPRAPINI